MRWLMTSGLSLIAIMIALILGAQLLNAAIIGLIMGILAGVIVGVFQRISEIQAPKNEPLFSGGRTVGEFHAQWGKRAI